jgi:hypothetical protein
MIFFLCFGFVVFVLGNPETPTVSLSFPKVCAPLQKKLLDRNRNWSQPGLKALLRLCVVDVGRCWSCVKDSARCHARTSVAQFRLFKLKSGRTDGCAADHDLNAICARPKCARAQVIDVLATVDPEV